MKAILSTLVLALAFALTGLPSFSQTLPFSDEIRAKPANTTFLITGPDGIRSISTLVLTADDMAALNTLYPVLESVGLRNIAVAQINEPRLAQDMALGRQAFMIPRSNIDVPLLAFLREANAGYRAFEFVAGMVTPTAQLTRGGQALTQGAVTVTAEGPHTGILLVNGDISVPLQTVYYGPGPSQEQIRAILAAAKLQHARIEILTSANAQQVSAPQSAILTASSDFQNPAVDGFLTIAPNMTAYVLQERNALEEVPLLERPAAPVVVAEQPTPAPVRVPVPAPAPPKPEVAAITDRDFGGTPGAQTITVTNLRGQSATFDPAVSAVLAAQPGYVAYLPMPTFCISPVYIMDVTHPSLARVILEAEERGLNYVSELQRSTYNYGCNGNWDDDRQGKVYITHGGEIIAEAAFDLKNGSLLNGTEDTLTWTSRAIDANVPPADTPLPGHVAFWHENFKLSIRDPEVSGALENLGTAEAAHFMGVNAPASWPEKQVAMEKAIAEGYPISAYTVAQEMLLAARVRASDTNQRELRFTPEDEDKIRLLVAKAVHARYVRARDLVSWMRELRIDVDTPIELLKTTGPSLTVAMMNSGPIADVAPRSAQVQSALQTEMLRERCSLISVLTDKYAQRTGAPATAFPPTGLTPSRFGCTSRIAGGSITLGIDRVVDLSCEGGQGTYLCEFHFHLSCNMDLGSFSSGAGFGTENLVCGAFTLPRNPATAVLKRDGGGWDMEDFVPARR